MRLVTIVSLAASAVLGLGALFVAKAVLPNAANAKGQILREAEGVPLVVAAKEIKYGTKLEPGMLTVVKVPQNVVPQGAFSSVSQALAADHGGAPVVLFPLSAKEPLLPTKLSGPGARPSVAAEVADGMRAYTIKVDDVSGVGGHALPGDRVDVVLMRDLTPDGPTRSYISYVVLQNVRVLGVDLNADITSNKPASPSTATLEVAVADTQKLAVAATLGSLSLALRRAGEADVERAPPLRTADFLGGAPAPRGPARAGPPRPVFRGILIVEGEAIKRAQAKRGGGKPTKTAKAASDDDANG